MSETLIYSSKPTPAWRFANPLAPWINLWQRRDLIYQLTSREIAGRYKGLNFGIFWSFINPLLMLGVYTFVFGHVMKASWGTRTGTGEFALTLFCGLSVFNIFAECLGRASSLIFSNPNYVKKVVFPLEILPVTAFGAAFFHGLISFSILMVFAVCIRSALPLTAFLFPVVLMPLVFLSIGVGWMLSALGVFLRDIGYVMNVVTQALVFVTPVFFPVENVAEKYRIFMYINPLSAVVENARTVLLRGEMPDWMWLLKVTLFSLVFMQIGYIFFMKSKKAFADVI